MNQKQYINPGKNTVIRAACVFLSALILLGVIFPFVNLNNDKGEPEGFVFSGSAFTSDGVNDLPEELSSVSVTANNDRSAIIPVDSYFTIKTTGATDPETLSKYLTVTPTVSFTLSTLSPTEFLLTPAARELDAGRIYSFTLGNPENPVSSYTFQTESELAVKSLLPADLAVGVPLNAGIEIAFTESVRNVKFENYISILPKIKGNFELYPDGRTVVFVPDENLAPNTVYTVQVKQGITSSSGRELKQAHEAKFRTGTEETSSGKETMKIYSENTKTIFSPHEYPTIYYNLSNIDRKTPKQSDIAVEIWRYSSADDAISAMKDYEGQRANYLYSEDNYLFPTKGLTNVGSYNIAPVSTGSNNYSVQSYFSLPQLEEGIYLVNYIVSGQWGGGEYKKSMQTIIQSTNLRVHTESSYGNTLFWVNNLKDSRPDQASAGPAAGATVTAQCFNRINSWNTEGGAASYTTLTGITDASGLAIIENGDTNAAYVKIEHGGEETIIPLLANADAEIKYFCKYIFTDREVYFPDDSVNYYGVLTPGGEEVLPSRLYVYVGSIPYGSVALGTDGSFSGNIPIENYTGYALYIRFCTSDGALVASKYVRVTQEDKPVYRASLSFDKLFYEFGDTITATVTASFFDGTPAPGLRFRMRADNPFVYDGEVVTGADGSASISIKTTAYPGANSTYPISIWVSAYLTGYETSSLSLYKSVYYFHSENQLRTERINGDYSEVYLNKTDTTRLRTQADLNYPAFPENIYGAPARGSVKVSLIKREFLRVRTGTRYDPITKTTIEDYTTRLSDSVIRSYTAEFEDGKIRLEHMSAEGFNGYYFYEISYYDAKNGADYVLAVYALKNNYRLHDNDSWYYYKIITDKEAYSEGDTVSVSYLYNGIAPKGKILYTLYDSEGFAGSMVGESDFSFRFTDSMALFCQVYATALDGSEFKTQSGHIRYDYEADNILAVEVLPDKESYAPGEGAAVRLRVTDKEGRPVAGVVLLSVVDEACFALGDQTLSPLGSYFSSVGGSQRLPYDLLSSYYSDYWYYYGYSSPIISISVNGRFNIFREISINNETLYYLTDSVAAEAADSQKAPQNSGSAESAIYIRENFSDNPVFEVIKLGEDGTALFSFTVPDNITEWRISALAYGNISSQKVTERKLGSRVSGVICTLPYFINLSACEYYIEGDDVTLSARSYGRALVSSQAVEYSATVYDGAGKRVGSLKLSSKSGEQAWFNFGRLPTGSYSAEVSAVCGKYSDGVRVNFSVVVSGNIVDVRRDISIDQIKTLTPLTYPLTLSFYNSAYDKYIDALNQINRNYSDARSDALAARYVALTASEKLFGLGGIGSTAEISATLNSRGSGLIPLLEYSEGDIELTAKICAVAPEALSSYRKADIINTLSSYIDAKKYTDPTELAAALLALGALGEPVLDRVYHIASSHTSFTVETKLYLAAALTYIGDFSAANELLALIKTEAGSEAEGGEYYIKGDNTEESIKLTSLALLTASRLSRIDAEKMIRYLRTHVSTLEYYGLEIAAYVKYFMPTERVESLLSYRFGEGEVEKVSVRAGGAYVLRLTKTGFDSLQILEADPSLRVRAAYGGSLADATDGGQKTGELTITKTITPHDAAGGLYKVTISFSGKTDRAYSSFSVSDCIPTGARFVSNHIGYNDGWVTVSGSKQMSAFIYHEGGQKMRASIWISAPYMKKAKWNEIVPEYSFSGSLSYIIRGAVTGSFVTEETLIQNFTTGSYAVSDRMYITIGDGKWTVDSIE